MDFDFEKVKQKVKQLSKDTVEEVQKMNEIRQLKGKISSAKKQIESTYTEIGKKFFELNSDSAPEGFEMFVQTIRDKQELIGQLKEQIRTVKGMTLCPNCGMEVAAGERFCTNCGSRMPEEPGVEEDGEAEDEVVAEVDAEDAAEEAAQAEEDAAEAAEEAAQAEEDAAEAAEDAAQAEEDAAEAAEDAAQAEEDAAEAAEDAAQAEADAEEEDKEPGEAGTDD